MYLCIKRALPAKIISITTDGDPLAVNEYFKTAYVRRVTTAHKTKRVG